METVTVKMTWDAFSILLNRHLHRVLGEMNAGLFLFADGAVTFRLPASALNEITYTQVH